MFKLYRVGRVLLFLLLLLLLVACVGGATPTEAPSPAILPEGRNVLILADIGTDVSEKVAEFQPLADYLAAELSEYGVVRGQVKVAPDLQAMTEWMEAGEVDIYFDSVYPAMVISDETGAEPILRRWKEGVSEYSTYIITREDSGIETLEALEGKMVAFSTPFSTSGYMLPLVYIIEAGLSPQEQLSTRSPVPAGKVGYVFSADDDLIVEWVQAGEVAAGAVNSIDYDALSEEERKGLRVLAETEAVPRHMVVVRPGMNSLLRQELERILTSMDESETGLVVLDSFEQTTRFDEFPGGGSQALARMRQLYEITQQMARRP